MFPSLPPIPPSSLTAVSSLPSGAFGAISVSLYTPPASGCRSGSSPAPLPDDLPDDPSLHSPCLVCTKTIPLNPEAGRSSRSGPAEPTISASLFREVLSLSLLSHPSILPLLSLDASPAGLSLLTPYYPLPLSALDATLPTALPLLPPLLSALAHAHSLNIAHRDVKPANILLLPSLPFPRAVLADWGLARVLPPPGGPLTLAISTRPYRPPESLLALPHATGADVYSLGVSFLQVLSRGWLGIGGGTSGDIAHTYRVLQCFGNLEGGESAKLEFPDSPFRVDPLLLASSLPRGGGVCRRLRRSLEGMLKVRGEERMSARELLEDGEGIFACGSLGGERELGEMVGGDFVGGRGKERDLREAKELVARRRRGAEAEGASRKLKVERDWAEQLRRLRAM